MLLVFLSFFQWVMTHVERNRTKLLVSRNLSGRGGAAGGSGGAGGMGHAKQRSTSGREGDDGELFFLFSLGLVLRCGC
jgi:hypothetical protein